MTVQCLHCRRSIPVPGYPWLCRCGAGEFRGIRMRGDWLVCESFEGVA